MSAWDYLVLAVYAAAMLAVGRYYATRTQSTDDYLLGGRNMSPVMIGLSLFATLTSTLSYLAMPGEMIKHGPMMFAQSVALPLAAIVVGWALIPFIVRLPVTSGYELLEAKLGLVGRLLGSGMFLMLRAVWMASILYATSNAFIVPLFELDPKWTPYLAAAMGILTVIYTAEGGLRAVVVTDAMQSIIMFAGAIASVAVIQSKLGGFDAWWPAEWHDHWEVPRFWPHIDARVTFVTAFVNMFVWQVCTAGSDQMAMQRYLATRDAAAARRSVFVHVIAETFIIALMALVGLAVLAYFREHPELLASGTSLTEQTDKLFPRFIMIGLPAGLTGLVAAAVLSAAMSSLSSGMNSITAVVTTDFIGRFRREPLGQAAQVKLARVISLAVGATAIALSMLVSQVPGNLMELCIKVVNLLTSPIFVLFFLAMFVPWAKPAGAVAATAASVSTAVAIAFYEVLGIRFMWAGLGSLLAGIAVGTLVSLLPMPLRDRPR
ncbi:MAG: sodium/solute symporter [Pirellulales bacterium]|nr:sodium/solute symporter [Pirellulales bacterium]